MRQIGCIFVDNFHPNKRRLRQRATLQKTSQRFVRIGLVAQIDIVLQHMARKKCALDIRCYFFAIVRLRK